MSFPRPTPKARRRSRGDSHNIRVRVWYYTCAYLLKVTRIFYKFVQDFGNVESQEA
ncbi:hypothetical protein BGY98DRAFT_396519 [Russula aff. rugulosa BPL654]|nr:hypothetical protein BGY98DRAFT_396519 [Russula aff. rugulosa BPL654]